MRRVLAGAAGLVLLAGCGGGTAGAAFTSGPTTQTCLVHQAHDPTGRYEAGTDEQSAAVLPFLSYFTLHGNQRFCDGRAANSHDARWAHLYVRLTANPSQVGTILAP